MLRRSTSEKLNIESIKEAVAYQLRPLFLMVIMFLKPERLSLYPFETGDTLHYSVINISLSSLHKLIYGDNDLYSEMIISKTIPPAKG